MSPSIAAKSRTAGQLSTDNEVQRRGPHASRFARQCSPVPVVGLAVTVVCRAGRQTGSRMLSGIWKDDVRHRVAECRPLGSSMLRFTRLSYSDHAAPEGRLQLTSLSCHRGEDPGHRSEIISPLARWHRAWRYDGGGLARRPRHRPRIHTGPPSRGRVQCGYPIVLPRLALRGVRASGRPGTRRDRRCAGASGLGLVKAVEAL